jgi:hypothetical protein
VTSERKSQIATLYVYEYKIFLLCISVYFAVGLLTAPKQCRTDIKTSLFLILWGGVRPSPFGTSANNWPIVPAPGDGWVWSSCCIENWSGNRSCWRKPIPVLLCLPQIPHELGTNWGLRCGKPRTNRLTDDTALLASY